VEEKLESEKVEQKSQDRPERIWIDNLRVTLSYSMDMKNKRCWPDKNVGRSLSGTGT